MTNAAPIFTSVGQALHVSFLMQVLPVTQKVSTQVLIESLREQLGKTEARLASSINTGGMSSLEFRGQCAMVTAAAHHHLPGPEFAAVRARFGHQLTKAEGVIALDGHLRLSVGIDHAWALRALLWSYYHRGSQRAADRWSLRAIEAQTGVSLQALRTAMDKARSSCEALERRAEASLEGLFTRTGLIPSNESSCVTA